MSNNKDFAVNGKEYIVKQPTSKEHKEAQLFYNQTFGDAIKSKAPLRATLNQYMKDQGLWSDEKAKTFLELVEFVSTSEKKLDAGGFKYKEALALAKELKTKRLELQAMLSDRGYSDSNTAEGQAENAKFQKLLVLCLVYKEDGKPVFPSTDSLLNETDETKLNVASEGFKLLGEMLYNLDSSYEHKLAENKFFKKFKLVDDKLRFINSKGELVDEQGRRIDEEGFLINEKNERINASGDKIDSEGNLVVEQAPFLDDDGNPIVV